MCILDIRVYIYIYMHVCVHSRYDILVIKQILSCKGQDLIGVDNLL